MEFDIFKDFYTVKGVAADIDTLFRIRDQLVGFAYEEMWSKGYIPQGEWPEIEWETNEKGYLDFTFKWRVSKDEPES